jgi:hypothetical protein
LNVKSWKIIKNEEKIITIWEKSAEKKKKGE